MPFTFGGKLVVAIASRARFDVEDENRILETAGGRVPFGIADRARQAS